MTKRVEKVSAANIANFYKVHSGECGWCYCTAWWTPSWEGWTDRTDEQNRKFREELFEKGEYDGYLLYINDEPVGWCQVGKRDRLVKLIKQYNLKPIPDIWAITCFVIKPEFRKKGLAKYLLKVVLEQLRAEGIKTIQAFPRRTESQEVGEQWRGPEKIYLSDGFKVKRDDPSHPILELCIEI